MSEQEMLIQVVTELHKRLEKVANEPMLIAGARNCAVARVAPSCVVFAWMPVPDSPLVLDVCLN